MTEIGLRDGAGTPSGSWPHRAGDGSGMLTFVTGNGRDLSPTLLAELSRRFATVFVLCVGDGSRSRMIRHRHPKHVRVLRCASATHGAAMWTVQARRFAGRGASR
ncbi:hypothetical protein ACRAWF_07675 [Streptomyces sp. L7]